VLAVPILAFERKLVLARLTSSEARLLELVDGLTSPQWRFRDTPGRWSTAENIEHLIAFENFITQSIAKVIEEPAQPDKKALAPAKEPLVLANSRSSKFNARESVRPAGRWPDTSKLVAALRASRARTLFISVHLPLNKSVLSSTA
jgi:hypothetical protein